MEKVIIVGTGCAGLTAAIYTARANLAPLVLEGHEPGGQLSTTTLVENFPGFKDGIDGPELIMNMKAQSERFGARFQYAGVTDFARAEGHIRVKIDDAWVETRTLIVASGASARYLGLENEKAMIGHGKPQPRCATCDGAFLPQRAGMRRRRAAIPLRQKRRRLSSRASRRRFYLIHRRDSLRASKIMADRALANPKIEPTLEYRAHGLPDRRAERDARLEIARHADRRGTGAGSEVRLRRHRPHAEHRALQGSLGYGQKTATCSSVRVRRRTCRASSYPHAGAGSRFVP